MSNYKWLLFDLGGVLANYIGPEKLKAMMRNPVEDREFHHMWLYSPTVRAFESGIIDGPTFTCSIIRELDLDVDPDDFLRGYPDFISGWFEGAEALLEELSSRHSLALLSNTNPLHWGKLMQCAGCERLFDSIFLSYQTGNLKPDSAAYNHVIRALGCRPEDILFFDDNQNNIQGAQDCGMHAVCVASFNDLKAKLVQLGC